MNTVFQHYALFPHLTVAQNIGFALRMLGRPKAEIAATVARMVTLVGLERGCEDRPPRSTLGRAKTTCRPGAGAGSGAEDPALGRTLVSVGVPSCAMRMRSELKALQRETGISFVFVTHDQDEALAMSDRSL